MKTEQTESSAAAHINRRSFLQSGATALAVSSLSGKTVAASGSAVVEWRNQQSGMAYRKLGRTGMMISEVVSGGDPVKLDNYEHLNLALEMGLNYLDMAPAYNQGKCEEAYGKLLANSSAKREKVYLTTKISSFNGLLGRMYRDVFNGLPQGKRMRF